MTGPLAATVVRMARRDAAAHLLPAAYSHSRRFAVEVVRCPWCGADRADVDRRPSALPLRADRPGLDWAPAAAGRPTLRMLGCEAVPVRALLVVGVRGPADGTFATRAAWTVGLPDALALSTVDAAEEWVEGGATTSGVLPLPAATGRHRAGTGAAAWAAYAAAGAAVLGPHRPLPGLDELYAATRTRLLARALRRTGR